MGESFGEELRQQTGLLLDRNDEDSVFAANECVVVDDGELPEDGLVDADLAHHRTVLAVVQLKNVTATGLSSQHDDRTLAACRYRVELVDRARVEGEFQIHLFPLSLLGWIIRLEVVDLDLV